MRFGVLGDAKIARTKLLPAIRAAGHKVTHLGRRDASAGADPAWGPVTVTSYDELLQDPQVDAVYNALPTSTITCTPSDRNSRQVVCPPYCAYSGDDTGTDPRTP